jgi:regulation of enolase protein 1 (concanavalin A-like superfamily)
MQNIKMDKSIFDNFYWLNKPEKYYCENALVIETEPKTDFWQRTHYGFRRDDGHALLTDLKEDFSFAAKFKFEPQNKYDQCGIMLRLDRENWIKISTEYENQEISRLGSVVTNLGYSDWATEDISSEINAVWYRVSRRGEDFLIENSFDGRKWSQMRIAHLHQDFDEIQVGVYACSPKKSSFRAIIEEITIDDNHWEKLNCIIKCTV